MLEVHGPCLGGRKKHSEIHTVWKITSRELANGTGKWSNKRKTQEASSNKGWSSVPFSGATENEKVEFSELASKFSQHLEHHKAQK